MESTGVKFFRTTPGMMLALLPLFLGAFLLGHHFSSAIGATTGEAARLLPPSAGHGALDGGGSPQSLAAPLARRMFAHFEDLETVRSLSLTMWLAALFLFFLTAARLLSKPGTDRGRSQDAALLIPAGALVFSQLFPAVASSLAMPGVTFALLLFSAALLLWTVNLTSARTSAACLAVLATCFFPFLFIPLLAIAAAWQIRNLRDRPSLALAISALVLTPFLLKLFSALSADSLTGALVGVKEGGIAPGFGFGWGWLAEQLAQAPATMMEGLMFLVAAWGQPVRLLAGLLYVPTSWINPVSLCLGAALLLHAPVFLFLAVVCSDDFTAAGHRHLAVSLLLTGLLSYLAFYGRSQDTAGAALALYPVFLLSLMLTLASRVPMRTSRGRPLLAVIIPLLVLAHSVDTVQGLRLAGNRLPALDSRVQNWLAGMLATMQTEHDSPCIGYAGSQTLGSIDLIAPGELTAFYLELDHRGKMVGKLPDRTVARCPGLLMVLENNARGEVQDAREFCRGLFAASGLTPKLDEARFAPVDAVAVGKGNVPGFCVVRLERDP